MNLCRKNNRLGGKRRIGMREREREREAGGGRLEAGGWRCDVRCMIDEMRQGISDVGN